jgi:hypothetical protein
LRSGWVPHSQGRRPSQHLLPVQRLDGGAARRNGRRYSRCVIFKDFFFFFFFLTSTLILVLLLSGQPLTSWAGPWCYLNPLSDILYSSNYYWINRTREATIVQFLVRKPRGV